MASAKYNTRNPAVKRILQEMKELQRDPSSDYMAAAIEDNIFEWHFAVRGPVDTEFQGGIYHGRILLPPEYPFKPPSFMLLTANGRFETSTKICLSISSHHPEHWQPSWSVRTALTALIAFFPTPGNGAIGSLDFSKDERAALALKARAHAPVFGGPDRQAVTDEVHAEMLQREPQTNASANIEEPPAASPPVSSLPVTDAAAVDSTAPEAAASSRPGTDALAHSAADSHSTPPAKPPAAPAAAPEALGPQGSLARDTNGPGSASAQAARAGQAAPAQHVPDGVPAQHTSAAQEQLQQPAQTLLGEVHNAVGAIAMPAPAGTPHGWEDTGLTMLAGVIVMLIAAILFRRILIISGADVTSLM